MSANQHQALPPELREALAGAPDDLRSSVKVELLYTHDVHQFDVTDVPPEVCERLVRLLQYVVENPHDVEAEIVTAGALILREHFPNDATTYNRLVERVQELRRN